MNAEALIGTVLGSCTLQKLVGQGGMGAVYLAQQSRPRRQVAVKVLLPMTPLSPHQLAAFLERFRRETDAAASLEHPHIMPVYEYGENDGLAYLVMPYISGGTLRDELEREGQLPLQKTVNYLEQIAAALDFAHEHGVIHRDIKPANIMVTPDGRLLLTDFGLVKIVAEGQVPQARLTGAGAPVGTPDYMSPEQVIGEEVDTRADLYSLGVILYQMVTGTTPFQGETPMQIAAQHLQIPPPSPQMMRRDLPIAAEQVILRALAKRPTDRYMRADDLAHAFRQALVHAGIRLEDNYTRTGMLMTASRIPVPTPPRPQFGLLRPTGAMPKVPTTEQPGNLGLLQQDGMPTATRPYPAASANMPATGEIPRTGGLLSRTGKFPMTGTGATGTLSPLQSSAPSPAEMEIPRTGGLLSRTGKFPMMGTGATGTLPITNTTAMPSAESNTATIPSPWTSRQATGTLGFDGTQNSNQNTNNLVKLTGPVKVLKVPVAGQPGQFVTGLLPVSQEASSSAPATKTLLSRPFMKLLLVAATILILLGGVGGLFFTLNHKNTPPAPQPRKTLTKQQATQATATAVVQANTLLADALDQNRNNWPVAPGDIYSFKAGAYHIANNQDKAQAALLGTKSFPNQMSYQMTMQEVNGDDASPENAFGMIFRCNQRKVGNKTITTFYTFEVLNTRQGGEYEFWKFDEANTDTPWSMINDGKLAFGNEFHQGKDQGNTIKIAMNGDKFTIIVNGTTLSKTFQDGSYTGGTIGMIVHHKGTEVAFKDLLLSKS
ncbi:serine/threonine protein kinase [Tengunoibacter tsumagoiensis]|nr:serine/threonine-protein kinase [Tengunoibacter tsumagoiensis]